MAHVPFDSRQLVIGKLDAFGPIEKSIEHTRFMLFRPFDVGKWFAIGLMVFLHGLGAGGLNFPTNFSNPGTGSGGERDYQEVVATARQYFDENTAMVLGIIAGVIIFGAALSILFAWLGSRGRLMFVRSVALNDASIGACWRDAGQLSASLFWFTVVFWLVSSIVMLVASGIGLFMFLGAVDQGANSFEEFFPAIAAALLIALFYVLIALPVLLLVNDFAVPLMYRFRVGIIDALGFAFRIAFANILPITLFYVIRIVVGIVKSIATVLAACLTCFIGLLPIINQTLIAPLHVFDRAYSMFAIESLGPDFKMIVPTETEVDPFDDSGQRDLTRY